MSIDIVGALMILWGLVAFFKGGQAMLNALVVSSLFGATAALALPAAGGVGVAPAYVMLGFLLLQMLLSRKIPDVLVAPLHVPGGFCLLGLVLWGAFSAMFIPRLLEGAAQISSVDRASSGVPSAGFELLHPVSGNFTQTGYAMAAVIGFSSMVVLLRSEGGYTMFRKAMVFLATATVLSAVLDLAGYYLLGFDILGVFKTADFILFNETELAGMKRIAGTFSEASAYASFSLTMFAFSFELYLKGVQKRLTRLISAALLFFLLISTSTTAYAALLIYTSLLSLHAFVLVFAKAEVKRFSLIGGSAMLLVIILALLVILSPVVHRGIEELIYTVILTKGQSESGVVRALLNANAWQAFLDTNGIGVGLGSSRASSYPLVILSNLGLPGAVLYLLWQGRTFTARKNSSLPADTSACISASRWALLASLITASISASVFDVGLLFYYLAAACVAHVSLRRNENHEKGFEHAFQSA